MKNQARGAHAAVTLPDGRVLVAGGIGTNNDVGYSSEIYDPAIGAWTNTGHLAHHHEGPYLILLDDGRALYAGSDGPGPDGFGDNLTPLQSAELENFSAETQSGR